MYSAMNRSCFGVLRPTQKMWGFTVATKCTSSASSYPDNGLEGWILLRLDNAMHDCHTDIALVPGCNRRVQKLNCPMHANRMDPDPKDIGARDLRIVTASGHKKHRCLLLLSVLDNVGHFSSLCSWGCNPTLACLEVETRSRSCNQTARLF